jgi:predicted nucleic acid-binding protein
MTLAVDSAVLIDLLAAGDDTRADSAEDSIRVALTQGVVVMSDVVVAEVCAGFGDGADVMDALRDAGITLSPMSEQACVRAGEMHRKYLTRQKKSVESDVKPRNVSDFLIGAHAHLQCDGLITYDQAFYRDYFKGLRLITPKILENA